MVRLRRWRMGYQAIGFVALIPVVSYYVITQGLPKKILLFVIPGYMLLAWSFYIAFKKSKPK